MVVPGEEDVGVGPQRSQNIKQASGPSFMESSKAASYRNQTAGRPVGHNGQAPPEQLEFVSPTLLSGVRREEGIRAGPGEA
ncbi:unnamed protein product [Boreogadus saida]